jgi:hypothetical protein
MVLALAEPANRNEVRQRRHRFSFGDGVYAASSSTFAKPASRPAQNLCGFATPLSCLDQNLCGFDPPLSCLDRNRRGFEKALSCCWQNLCGFAPPLGCSAGSASDFFFRAGRRFFRNRVPSAAEEVMRDAFCARVNKTNRDKEIDHDDAN